MNGRDEEIESVLRTALHDAADQIDVRPRTRPRLRTSWSSVGASRVVRQWWSRSRPVSSSRSVVGGSLLFSASHDPSSVQTPAGAAGGCAGKAYVVDGGNGDGTGAVFAITTATGEVSTPIPVSLSTSGGPFGAVAITPDGKYAYVTHGDHNTVLVIDTATGVVSATIPVGAVAFEVAITPDGKHVYVTTGGDGTVSVIDTATGAVSATIPVGRRSGRGGDHS